MTAVLPLLFLPLVNPLSNWKYAAVCRPGGRTQVAPRCNRQDAGMVGGALCTVQHTEFCGERANVYRSHSQCESRRSCILTLVPELPEVETVARGLNKRVAGDSIESVWIGSKKQPLKSPAALIAKTIEDKKILQVHRAGKHIVFDLEPSTQGASSKKKERKKPADAVRSRKVPTDPSNAQWIVHLGMTGRLLVSEPAAEIVKHTHLIAKLSSGRELRFIDPRMFGKLSVHAGGFDPGGIEPLESTAEQFITLFRGRKTPIKSALLNQKLLRGVGNIYADEALFRAGIRPRRRASTISRSSLAKLHGAVIEVLREAIARGGSSISNYVDADGEEGFFQLEHRVYGREGEVCLVCGTSIQRIAIAGRSSHYCAKCQK
jgi:formamidopyrimidine-DNA glycosylase